MRKQVINTTEKELDQVYFLRKEIIMWQKQLDSISDIPAINYDVGGGSGTSSPVTRTAERREKIRQIIAEKQEEIALKEQEITAYIVSIDDSLIRQIMYKRHIKLMSWPQIAKDIGGATPDSLRMIYKRFLQND